jgi:hypothetical protein
VESVPTAHFFPQTRRYRGGSRRLLPLVGGRYLLDGASRRYLNHAWSDSSFQKKGKEKDGVRRCTIHMEVYFPLIYEKIV